MVHRVGRANPEGGPPKNRPGDIVMLGDDDMLFGTRIENNPGFMKLLVVGLPNKQFNMQNLPEQNPVPLSMQLIIANPNPVIVQDRRFQIDFDSSGIDPQQEHATINVSSLILIDKGASIPARESISWNITLQEFEY